MSMRGRLMPPVVLAYHGVARVDEQDDPSRLVLDPARFESQLRTLRTLGYEFTTAEQLAGAGPGARPPRGTAVLTFDDGWLDAVDAVVPRLSKLGIPATFYVCPGWLGGRHPLVAGPAGRLLAPDHLVALRREGMEVASHSMLHRDLRLLADDELTADLADSKAMIERVLDRPCRTFAYPYGLVDDRVERAVGEAGYELAFAWSPGSWQAHRAPRLPTPPRHGGARLALKLLGVRRPAR